MESIWVTDPTFRGIDTVFVFLNINLACLVVVSICVTYKYHSKPKSRSIEFLGRTL
ncbi:hypothetical protein MCHI_003380 [Candidatus Magnetoovum chiemensis]|nr:hypothetical protein MCHI_003380 [Candidatus Magnetoovum chiemensis]